MNKTLLRVIVVVVTFVLLVLGYAGSVYLRAGSAESARSAEEKQLEANADAYYADVAAHTKERLAKEAADTYGGATPEETWRLFIDALEQEDAELAAKYFVVDKQEEIRKELEESKKLGNIVKYAKLIDIEKRGKYQDDEKEYYTFVTEPVGDSDVGMLYQLQINPQTHVWKILSL
jgi:uncharacterized membrane protein